eukprot:TRINITY_DN4974_c0_g1_i3.p1 TRINITY_DN4974_c0_g1~~TRINITY_DN4974_c0_g1_i3.p1  ORF type:complete len:1768 (+),score=557.00 TRINITY_DN4974_c0_g1_i3:2231-7534(+)
MQGRPVLEHLPGVREDADIEVGQDLARHVLRRLCDGRGRRRFRIDQIFVDEVQDLSVLQLQVLLETVQDAGGLFVAGDTAQTITRGSRFRFQEIKRAIDGTLRRRQTGESLVVDVVEEEARPDAIVGKHRFMAKRPEGPTTKVATHARRALKAQRREQRREAQQQEALAAAQGQQAPEREDGEEEVEEVEEEEELCWRKIEVADLQLSRNYRSHAGILRLAACIVDTLKKLFPEGFDVMPRDCGTRQGPRPVFLGTGDVDELRELFRKGERTIELGHEQAVLVRDSDRAKEEVRRAMGENPVVFTVIDAKGQEFEDVLLFNFFKNSPVSSSDWRGLDCYLQAVLEQRGGDATDLPTVPPIPSPGLLDELKALYCAVTRARSQLWFYDEDVRAREPFLRLARHATTRELVKYVDFAEDTALVLQLQGKFAKTSTPGEWFAKGMEFFKKKKYESAKKCFQHARGARDGEPAVPEAAGWEHLSEAHYLRQYARGHLDHKVGALRRAAQQFDAAVEAFDAAEFRCDRVRLVRHSAKCLEHAGDIQDAGRRLQSAGNSALDELAAELFHRHGFYREAGEIYRKLGKHELALRSFLSRQDRELLGLAVGMLEDLGRSEGALAASPTLRTFAWICAEKLVRDYEREEMGKEGREGRKKDWGLLQKALWMVDDPRRLRGLAARCPAAVPVIVDRLTVLKERRTAADVLADTGSTLRAAELYLEGDCREEALKVVRKVLESRADVESDEQLLRLARDLLPEQELRRGLMRAKVRRALDQGECDVGELRRLYKELVEKLGWKTFALDCLYSLSRRIVEHSMRAVREFDPPAARTSREGWERDGHRWFLGLSEEDQEKVRRRMTALIKDVIQHQYLAQHVRRMLCSPDPDQYTTGLLAFGLRCRGQDGEFVCVDRTLCGSRRRPQEPVPRDRHTNRLVGDLVRESCHSFGSRTLEWIAFCGVPDCHMLVLTGRCLAGQKEDAPEEKTRAQETCRRIHAHDRTRRSTRFRMDAFHKALEVARLSEELQRSRRGEEVRALAGLARAAKEAYLRESAPLHMEATCVAGFRSLLSRSDADEEALRNFAQDCLVPPRNCLEPRRRLQELRAMDLLHVLNDTVGLRIVDSHLRNRAADIAGLFARYGAHMDGVMMARSHATRDVIMQHDAGPVSAYRSLYAHYHSIGGGAGKRDFRAQYSLDGSLNFLVMFADYEQLRMTQSLYDYVAWIAPGSRQPDTDETFKSRSFESTAKYLSMYAERHAMLCLMLLSLTKGSNEGRTDGVKTDPKHPLLLPCAYVEQHFSSQLLDAVVGALQGWKSGTRQQTAEKSLLRLIDVLRCYLARPHSFHLLCARRMVYVLFTIVANKEQFHRQVTHHALKVLLEVHKYDSVGFSALAVNRAFLEEMFQTSGAGALIGAHIVRLLTAFSLSETYKFQAITRNDCKFYDVPQAIAKALGDPRKVVHHRGAWILEGWEEKTSGRKRARGARGKAKPKAAAEEAAAAATAAAPTGGVVDDPGKDKAQDEDGADGPSAGGASRVPDDQGEPQEPRAEGEAAGRAAPKHKRDESARAAETANARKILEWYSRRKSLPKEERVRQLLLAKLDQAGREPADTAGAAPPIAYRVRVFAALRSWENSRGVLAERVSALRGAEQQATQHTQRLADLEESIITGDMADEEMALIPRITDAKQHLESALDDLRSAGETVQALQNVGVEELVGRMMADPAGGGPGSLRPFPSPAWIREPLQRAEAADAAARRCIAECAAVRAAPRGRRPAAQDASDSE